MLRSTIALLCFLTAFSLNLSAQSNILLTNPTAANVLMGNFNPNDYLPTTVIDDHNSMVTGLVGNMSPDSLKSYLVGMSAFQNRNTGSDTVSNVIGMGAARRWAHRRFEDLSALNEDRLLVSYVQFDEAVCGVNQHRNILAVLPGTGPQSDEVILVEAHFDSRCEDPCDSLCAAHGMEDNGSGSALVMELARVMAPYTYNRTIAFMLTTGEEQGLWGATAMAQWCDDNNVNVHAVFNNDIVGGVICGETASPPGCPGLNDVDSINVRLYSFGTFNSFHKSLARFTKLQYTELVSPLMTVPTIINILTPEDRTGRGGDHIPFRQQGYTSIRMTSANEHGHGSPNSTYNDRQHSFEDVLGLDTNNDNILDTFFVDFNYLKRNAIINGTAMAMAAIGPIALTSITVTDVPNGLVVSLNDPNNYGVYRVGVRSATNDFDTVYTWTGVTSDTLWGLPAGQTYRISAATVDANGIESLFSHEVIDNFTVGLEDDLMAFPGITLLQNRPNPFDEATTISVRVEGTNAFSKAEIVVLDIQGREVKRFPITIEPGVNEVLYWHEAHKYQTGVYAYSLFLDDQLVDTKQMVFAW